MMDLQSLFTLKGKTALVTGGSRGIGAMIAEGLVTAGCRVYISSRKTDVCDETAKRLNKNPGECLSLPGDVSTIAGIESLVASLSEREESIDILVNNAGVAWGESFEEFPEKGWDRVMDLNAKSVFFLTQKMMPLLKQPASADDPSRVINITSVLGSRPNPMMAFSYCASKAALAQMTKNLAFVLAKDNITVNGISPGFFPSQMTEHIMEDEDANAEMLSKARFQRYGKAEEIAGLSIYLCSKSGAFVTGEIIVVDGGLLLAC